MFDSPLSASPYEVLGVDPAVGDDELRRVYRLRLRETHPDTGGDAAVFIRVQHAWELIGTPEQRAAFDRSRGSDTDWDGWRAPTVRTDTRPRPKTYGEPGVRRRARYVELLREWAGHEVDDPYAPSVVRAAPRELRRLLANALAEEGTADAAASLGMGFTLWHGVAVEPEGQLDHVILGPSGLYGVTSADFGGVVGFRGGEITGPSLGHQAPVTTLLAQVRTVARAGKVRFSAALVVLPDDDLAMAITPLGRIRDLPVAVVRRSALPGLLRSGLPGTRVIGGNELFDLRTRLRQSIRFA
ncbi:J domain-containing protein [Streptomyces sp. AC495_CC817]|uniref:J domain-containing protein n=1 Tax=Streptomyces sp. AC495_CC817 TaxID=2823900 RepID=UPI001C26A927|nr:DnaJ domain-containing protein [Streptomyces sp. AC495_CC817]